MLEHRQLFRQRALWIRLSVSALAAASVFVVFRHVDWTTTTSRLALLGARAPLVLAPYFLMLLADSLGWKAMFERPISTLSLWRIRAATEAVMNSLPAGVAVGESLRVVLLARMFGISRTTASANVVLSKLAVALAQGVFIVCGAALALAPPEAESMFAGRPEGGPLGLAVALGFLAAMTASLFALVRGRVLSRGLSLARRLLGIRAPAALARLEQPLARADHALSAFARLPRGQASLALALFLLGWLCLGLETWLVLRLLEVRIPFGIAVSVEAVASLVRIGFFFLPGGLGAQEAAYYGLLRAYHVPHAEAVAAAFVVVKRAKELAWIGLGYVILLSLPARPSGVAGHSEPR